VKKRYWISGVLAGLIVLGMLGILGYSRVTHGSGGDAVAVEIPEEPDADGLEVAVAPDLADNAGVTGGELTSAGAGGSGSTTDLVDERLVAASTRFGFRLFAELVEEGVSQNIFMSPPGLGMALAMTYNGAGGEMKQAMAESLELQDLSLQEVNQAYAALIDALTHLDPDVQLEVANSLWGRQGVTFKPDFIERDEAFYGAAIRYLDFDDPRAATTINDWVREQSGQRIDTILDEIDRDAALFLMNGVTFQWKWTVGFPPQYTREREFTRWDGSSKPAPMMVSQSERYLYYQGDGFAAVGLPYGSGRVRMVAFLPSEGLSLDEFYGDLDYENWERWMSELRQEEVRVVLPRLKLAYGVTLNAPLTALGMGAAFGPGADFTNMLAPGPGFIGEVKHHTYLEVNEEGTAAGSTASVRIDKGGCTSLVFDRPFFYAIVDSETGTILFMGAVVEP
jgi:serine protease inhibitor